jgi:HSP20 family protein
MAAKTAAKTKEKRAKTPVPVEGDWFENRLTDFRHQMDRLFDSFTGAWHLPSVGAPLGGPGLAAGGITVQLDVSETEDAYEVTAELPGIEEKDIEVVLDSGMLTVKGEKKAESEKKQKDYYLMERRYGSFRRSFRLPEMVDEDKIKARFDKGVLVIVLPKLPEARKKVKKIKIS